METTLKEFNLEDNQLTKILKLVSKKKNKLINIKKKYLRE